jgi:hypothetical protein
MGVIHLLGERKNVKHDKLDKGCYPSVQDRRNHRIMSTQRIPHVLGSHGTLVPVEQSQLKPSAPSDVRSVRAPLNPDAFQIKAICSFLRA